MISNLGTFMSWADNIRSLKVMANADTPEDAVTARNNGAQGIGLCMTEHMFFASDVRIKAVRMMIMAVTTEQRKAALNQVLPYQRSDFEGIFRAIDGLPVTIRLLDPPLQEFLPEVRCFLFNNSTNFPEYHGSLLLNFVNMLGISYPELMEMQARAVFQAAVSMSNQGIKVYPEIMVPLVGTPPDRLSFIFSLYLWHQVSLIRSVANKVFSEMGSSLSFKVGNMIEIPRAAHVAEEIAKEAEFFSFGTNDLTQMTFGYRRDDVGKFLPIYLSNGILQADPFEVGSLTTLLAFTSSDSCSISVSEYAENMAGAIFRRILRRNGIRLRFLFSIQGSHRQAHSGSSCSTESFVTKYSTRVTTTRPKKVLFSILRQFPQP
ncbi:hypothetical protein MLD38_039669 [Melastoma candidum]|uniref:Uncharacterized protein n=1 Tax=Melastoma candidum TaxID=119954 RepID=A0ACB9L2U5_9MYRT|nr:hypothetical protein MLD38_039669 [Melastoma candidum]